jgi:hypothetical protein
MVNIMAKQSIATTDLVKGKLVLTFANGGKVECDPSALSAEIKDQLVLHGLTQKLRDSFAGAKGDANYAQAQAEGVWEALIAGEWNRRGGGAFGGNLLAEAVARLKEIEVSEARERLAGLTDDQREALKKSPSVKKMILTIKAERANAAADGDDEALDMI